MMNGDTKLALHSIKTAKWRSLLTMLGIIIGVASVIVTVSLGEGVKQQVSNQLSQFGNDLITVRPGKSFNPDQNGVLGINLFSNVSATLTDKDVKIVEKSDGVKISAPLSIVSAVPRYDGREFNKGLVIGTSYNLPELINHKVQYGSFFTVGEEGRNVAVLGSKAAQELFQENVPIGKSFQMRGEEFIVRGVFSEFENNPVTPGGDYNNAVFIPYTTGKTLSEGNAQVFQIFAKPKDQNNLDKVTRTIHDGLMTAHDQQEDFTIFTQGKTLDETSYTLSLITAMIAGVAGISLFVGGIGIMNIMLVSVTERTREIGIRKAVGATNRQIMRQFLTEAIILSIVGSIIGVILSLVVNFVIRMTTELEPAVDFRIAGIAVGVAVIVGVVFGIAPAFRASRKDPIDALRYQ
ncbi:MAG: ABC transporter permease [Candidatus Nomurabacteria bacterium]|nr:ABC transporter permease [Candidatus Saccharibacteria bacterium]USN95562.1 MAG: ABC transporter permease [Candidatus Nomurabacteria bacterium]